MIHPLAFVDGTVTIGALTKVWQFASVIRGAVLGRECTVASNVTLDGPRFGDHCIICPGVDMGPGFLVGNDVFVGPNVVMCNDAWPRTHKTGWDRDEIEQAVANGRFCVVVEDGASIGANAVIMPGVRIGNGAMIAAGAIVCRDVPAWALLTREGGLAMIDDESRLRVRYARERVAPTAPEALSAAGV